MKVIIDTCIIVDALQNRQPFCNDAQSIILLCANQQFDGTLTAKTITDIYYLTHRQTHNETRTREILMKLCILFKMADTTVLDIRNAISSDISDFEDAVMIETALRSSVDCIVTRNIKDFSKSLIPIYEPSKFLEVLNEHTKENSFLNDKGV